MKVGEWLTAMVKKPETWVFLFVFIWVIGGVLVFLLYLHYSRYTVPHLIAAILWGIVSLISLDVFFQRADLEKWVYTSLQSEWKFINVRRTFNAIADALQRGTYWSVFETNNMTAMRVLEKYVPEGNKIIYTGK